MNGSDNPFEQAASAESICIVDTNDNVIGGEERQLARKKGLIHRIVRVIIMNSAGQVLIQRRGDNLIDHPGKWEWSASGHVQAGEDYAPAAAREMREEIGINPPLRLLGTFYLEEKLAGSITLKRFNGVFLGRTDDPIETDTNEVAAIRWVSPAELAEWLASQPEDFTSNALEGLHQFLPSLN